MNQQFSAAVALLSSKSILDRYLNGETFSLLDIKLEIFLAQRNDAPYLPNQIHENNHEYSSLEDNINQDSEYLYDILYSSLDYLVDNILEINNNGLQVKTEYITQWQDIILNVNPLLLIAKKYSNSNSNPTRNLHSTLPEIKSSYLSDKNFIELHIHINGTSEPLYNWLYYLQHTKDIYENVKLSYEKATLQYLQLGINSKSLMYELLEKSKYVREFLYDYSNNQELITDFELSSWIDYIGSKEYEKTPYCQDIFVSNDYKEQYSVQNEFIMFRNIFNYDINTTEEKELVSFLVHFYMLVQSLFNRFLVQQSDQSGFSQFQFITDNKLRDAYEDEGLKDRYRQLKGIYGSPEDLSHLELRFAPKNTVKKMIKMYQQIFVDYNILKENKEIKYSISVIAHFIKFPSKYSSNTDMSCRWADTRAKLERQAHSLIATLNSAKRDKVLQKEEDIKFFESFHGLDAAGNELYVRPEVFVPIFNYLNKEFKIRFKKKLCLTFHAGEDYVHLLSGIRYVWEAIHFLGMDESDKWKQCRIGHATALGIEPQFWADKLDSVIVMSKGEWLDSMIFAKNLLSSMYDYDEKTDELWEEVYGIPFDDIKAWVAYKNRRKNPYECEDEIVKLYNSPEVVEKYNEMIEVSIDKRDIEIMTQLQRKVLKLMKDNEIAIESMITSNVRISYYDKYEQHHIYRWLFPEGAEEDIMPPIVLASDDPGLFNNNMRIEFSHLYEILKKKGIHEGEIETKINELQENANTYTFK